MKPYNPILVPCVKCERGDKNFYPYIDIKKSYPITIAQNLQTLDGFQIKNLQGFLCKKHWDEDFGEEENADTKM